jgi:hypothetical protein
VEVKLGSGSEWSVSGIWLIRRLEDVSWNRFYVNKLASRPNCVVVIASSQRVHLSSMYNYHIVLGFP